MGQGGGVAGRLERGEVRFFRFPKPDKQRPVLILTRTSALEYLARVTVAPVTSTIRGVPSEVVLGPEQGMKQPCAVNLHNVVTVPRSGIGRLLTQLDAEHMSRVCGALAFSLGCDEG
jgi:mRNA interferase MazF